MSKVDRYTDFFLALLLKTDGKYIFNATALFARERNIRDV